MTFHEQNPWIREHLELYRKDPVKAHDWPALSGTGTKPTLLLTTKGRKSGNPYTTPLVYGRYGQSFVVIGSFGGAPEHPAWFKNLEVDSAAEIQVKTDHYRVRARVASGDERATLWKLMVEILPHYEGMAGMAAGAREIPVVVLEPQ